MQVPKLFNGKNRLFFMTNYEGFKSRTTTTEFFTTMTPAMRAGDFSAVPTPLQDPATRVRTPNPWGHRIHGNLEPFRMIKPASRFNPSSVYLLEKFAPLPNIAQTGLPIGITNIPEGAGSTRTSSQDGSISMTAPPRNGSDGIAGRMS